jgi:hypothetical protein
MLDVETDERQGSGAEVVSFWPEGSYVPVCACGRAPFLRHWLTRYLLTTPEPT